MHSNTPKNSEVDAYSYIKEELAKLGWNIKNPARVPTGEVYKQNEALYNDYIKECLDRDMPEAVVKLNDSEFWVIESKRDKSEIEKALNEAKNQYALKINKSKKIKCILITGIAGNDIDGFTVINQFLHDGTWETVLFNGKTKDTLLSKDQALYIRNNNTINYKDFPDFPEEKYFSSAEKINEVLHNAGINKNNRAKFIAGLVLSLSLGQEIDLRIENTSLLVKNINNLIETKLSEVNKGNFFSFIRLVLPPSEENHIKYRQAITDTLKELQTLDIKNAMASGNDVLGKFYEKFLKYGNGAKEIGIVLTPRHVTEFAVNVIDVKPSDYILDPCCGTGGFLVSGFDFVRNNSTPSQLDEFKRHHMFGIDQDDEVIALALVNMIFRGDGRNNMSEGNCFQKNIEKTIVEDGGFMSGKYVKRDGEAPSHPIVTKVLMNPPFALKKGDEKERNFIDYALSQMQPGGILFAIVPISVVLERSGLTWRKDLLRHHTLMSVVTFPEDLFYPVSVGTVGIFIKVGAPHDYKNQKVYFARATSDGFKKKKGKRIEIIGSENRLQEINKELRVFMSNQDTLFENIPEFKKVCVLDPNDKTLEFAPEGYIDSNTPTLNEIQRGIEDMIAEAVAFKIRYRDKLKDIK